MVKKIVPKKNLKSFVAKLRRSRKKIVFTNGIFDLLHAGHVNYLRKAKALGDILIVGLNTDTSTRINKGPNRPLVTYRHRAQVLAALEMVDYIVPLVRKTPDKLIELIKPDVLVKGADYKLNEIVGADFVRKNGGRVVRVRITEGISTTYLISKIRCLRTE